MHWSAQYIGQPYINALQDCAAFIVRVQKEIFNRAIALPTTRVPGIRNEARQIQNHKDDYADPTDTPVDGDAVLMLGRGRMNHIGVYCLINNEPWVLHAMRNAGQVVLHRIRELERQGLQVEGFYRWR